MANATAAPPTPSQNHVGVNLSYTKFLFVMVRDDEAIGARLRTAGASIARGFFNDFDADGSREGQAHETIQFFSSERRPDAEGLAAARHLVQVSCKYRPRLQEAEVELRRRLGDAGEVTALDGAHRNPRYTSAELYDHAYRKAQARQSGRQTKNVFILPINKTRAWWRMGALDRHAYFYPHVDGTTGKPVDGHARTADRGVHALYRRLFHNPDGYERLGEFDFITYFEFADEHVDTFDKVHEALRDTTKNPEWAFVEEGPLWRGTRLLRW
jgi:hypothetical protein